MTEDEAKTKWCPFARRVGIVDWNYDEEGQPRSESVMTGWNRRHDDIGGTPDPHCIGSACMAWRWRTTPVWVNKTTNAIESFEGLRDHDFTEWYIGDQPTSHGHCGLAGKS